jgi:hypothetical protein
VIAFATLVNNASDEQFEQQIDSYIDVEAFLRYLAANALSANLESFLALGHNYTLYLDPKTNKFQFIPGDLEFSLANLLLFGSPDELMDLSVMKPYPGENKLPDRLLANPKIAAQYQKLLKELASTVFTRERLLSEAAAIDRATNEIRAKEQQAAAARPAQPGLFGGPGPQGPQPPDLKLFAERRTQSVSAQLEGESLGYIPRPFSFGPPPGTGGGGPGAGNSQPIDEATFRARVNAPP